MSRHPRHGSKKFKCSKCGGTYESPRLILEVLCSPCTRSVSSRGREVWMEPMGEQAA